MKRRSILKALVAMAVISLTPALASAKRPLTDEDVNLASHLWARALIVNREQTTRWFFGNERFINVALRKYVCQGNKIMTLCNESEQMPQDDINHILWGLENIKESTHWR